MTAVREILACFISHIANSIKLEEICFVNAIKLRYTYYHG